MGFTHRKGGAAVTGRRLIPTVTAARGALLAGLVLLSASALALPATASAEECPNAQFRTGSSAHLPDCRAYEMVTPQLKNAGGIEELDNVSPNGTSLRAAITAATVGAEGDPYISFSGAPAYYSITRTPSGWSTAPENLPSTEYITPVKLNEGPIVSLDGERNAWLARRVGQPGNSLGIFVREPGGSLVEAGPAAPSSAPVEAPTDLLEAIELHQRGISVDGSRVFFSLGGEGMGSYWPGDETHGGRASLYEYVGTGNTAPLLVGVNDNGEQIGQCGDVIGGATEPESYGSSVFDDNAVSADGNTVFFSVFPGGCGGSGPPVAELFARIDNGLPGAHTVSISEPSEEDCAACYENGRLTSAGRLAGAMFVGASEDGSKVFFYTKQPLLGSDASNNLYEYDFDAPPGQRLGRVSAGDATVSGPAAEVMEGDGFGHAWVQVSQDGSHVYFLAAGVLTQTPNRQGETAEAGAPNLYVFEQGAEHPSGRLAFIETLSTADLSDADGRGFEANTTPDGRFLVFTSNRDLTPDDTSTTRQLFEYDAQTGVLARVSIGEEGYNHDGNTPANFVTIPRPCYSCGNYEPAEYWSHLSVSADGAYVFFQSPAALTPQAIEGFNNVYEYHDGRVSLISDGADTAITNIGESVVRLLGTDASGGDVFFTTSDRLVGQDGDSSIDIYDARVDGGFPGPAAPSPCEGEGCQGPLSGAPTLLSPGSEFQAGGNPPLAGEAAPPPSKAKSGKRAKSAKKAKGKRKKGVKARKSSGRRRRS
jgi:hypothetical protein